jgi:hypothetical protein
MDANRFDRLVISIAASRRRLFGLVAGGALAAGGRNRAAAKCGKAGRPCQHGCCDGAKCHRGRCRCVPDRPRCGHVCCEAGEICVQRKFCGPGACPPGADICTGSPQGCNGGASCFCLTSFVNGETSCGGSLSCDACASDADCAGLGDGAFCARKTGESCCTSSPLDSGVCARPCVV